MSQLAPGAIVADRYRIDGIVGTGGSATVFCATDRKTQREVAIKLMHTGLSNSIAEQKRLAREAELVRQLKHPNILRLLDYGTVGRGVPFLVFPLLKGRTLEERLQAERKLAPHETGRIALQILSALEQAHGLDVVHRDIKLANIFLVSSPIGEVVRLLDFGLARVVSERDGEELTQVGCVVGTPRYMSPEQARGEPVGQSADIYSLGLVMAEMLTGVPVVIGPSVVDMFAAHGSDRPLDLPPEVLASPFGPIIKRAVNKSLSVRYRLASQMLADVRAAMDRIEDAMSGEGLDFGGDFEVTKLLDRGKASLPFSAPSQSSEKMRRAFNALLASQDRGSAARAGKKPAAAAERDQDSSPPTRQVKLRAEPDSKRRAGSPADARAAAPGRDGPESRSRRRAGSPADAAPAPADEAEAESWPLSLTLAYVVVAAALGMLGAWLLLRS